MGTIRKYWKRFADWDTGSEDKVLRKARLKLAFYYLLLLAVVLFIHGSFLCFLLGKNFERNFDTGADAAGAMAAREAVGILERNLISVDITVLVLGGVFGYALAKNTLKPVKRSFILERRFSADTSHELRTPLAIMKTDSEVLLRNKKSNAQDLRRLAERNLEEIDRMSKTVEDLLTLSREEKGDKVRRGKINLSYTAGRLAERMEALAQAKKITIGLGKMEEGLVPGNRAAMERAILNIFQNAISYTPSGGNINVAVHRSGGYMTLSVKDTGIGISKKDLSRIFERFYKADFSRNTNSEGAGLGLAIVKEVVEKHGGKVKISSRLGKGTGVTVQFPRVVD